MSLRSSERGLKFVQADKGLHCWVAPFVGAWIEIMDEYVEKLLNKVAPFVGAWIEIL